MPLRCDEGSAYLGRHWSARGYDAVLLQHPDSDDGVWQDVPKAKRLAAMNQAASPQNLLLRVRDVVVVLDHLTAWQRQAGHTLASRNDLARVGMSDHSFGAMTTQAVSGQSLPAGEPRTVLEKDDRWQFRFNAAASGGPQRAGDAP